MKGRPRFARTAEIDQVLLAYDGPQLVLLNSDRGFPMLGIAVAKGDMSNPFFSCELQEKDIRKYFDEKYDLHYTFQKSIARKYYFFDIAACEKGSVDLLRATEGEAGDENYWPSPGSFSRCHTSTYKLRYVSASEKKFMIDGNWAASDFSLFHGKMADLYVLLSSLVRLDSDETTANARASGEMAFMKDLIHDRFWQGGGSYVGFYDQLESRAKDFTPLDVAEIKYASPGHISFRGEADIFAELTQVSDAFDESATELQRKYSAIYGVLRKQKLLRAKSNTQFASKALGNFVGTQAKELAGLMRIGQIDKIMTACDHNVLVFAKLILSVYRRANDLHRFQAEGRVRRL